MLDVTYGREKKIRRTRKFWEKVPILNWVVVRGSFPA